VIEPARILPVVYVAGPITSPSPMHNTHRAVKVGHALQDTGLMLPIVPHLSVLADMIEPRDYEAYMAYDLSLLHHVHALYRLWGESSGADREVAYAHQIGLPVFTEVIDNAFNKGWADLIDFCGAWRREWA